MSTPKTGQTALITGASSGIGRELAKLFAQDGYNLVLVARNGDEMRQLAEEFYQNSGIDTTIIEKDLSKEDVGQEVYNEVTGKGITVNILVNDAGVGVYGQFATETNWDAEKAMIHLNAITLTQLTKLFLKDMVARNEGKILNLASMVALTSMPLQAVYAGTKSYILNFTQSLANELKDTNVTITALLPNATDTEFFNRSGAGNTKAVDIAQDPVMVAKDGYEGLMKGTLKVIPGGVGNKAQEIMSYVAPREMLSSMTRGLMEPKDPAQDKKKSALAWGLGIAAVLVAGVFVASMLTESDNEVYDDVKRRYKVGKAKSKASGLLDDARDTLDTVKDKFEDVKSKFADTSEEVVKEAKGKYKDAKSKVDAKGKYKDAKSKFEDVKDAAEDVAHHTVDKWDAIKNIVTKVVIDALA